MFWQLVCAHTCAYTSLHAVVVTSGDMLCALQVEVFCNEFLQLEPSVLFRDSEVLQDGNIDDWMQTDPDNGMHVRRTT